jgi:hypothetical protein
MSGAEFLRLTTYSDTRVENIVKGTTGRFLPIEIEQSGAVLLVVDQDGQVISHDGRHRAVRFAQRGKEVPVLLIGATPDVNPKNIKTLQSQKFGEKTRGAVVVPMQTQYVGEEVETDLELDMATDITPDEQSEDTTNRTTDNPNEKARPYMDVHSTEGKAADKTLLSILKNERGSSPEVTEATKKLTPPVKKLLKKIKEKWQALHDWVDVEARFKRADKAHTGLALKNFYSRRAARQTEGMQKAREFMDVVRENTPNVTDIELEKILLAYENDSYFTDELTADEKKRFRPAITWLENFFEETKQEMADRGFKVDFQKRMLDKLERKMENASTNEQRMKIFDQILEVEQLHYANVPVAVYALRKQKGKEGRKNYLKMQKMLKKGLTPKIAQKRRVISMLLMKKSKKFKHITFNPVEVIMNYENRNANDHALMDLRDAMIEDGLLVAKGKKKPSGFKKLDNTYGVLAGTAVHKDAQGMIDNLLSSDDHQNWYDKTIAITKMMQFFNPIFLPAYDVYQGVMSGAYGKTPWGLAKNLPTMARAMRSVATRDKSYLEAMRAGLFSKPFDMPFSDYKSYMKSIRDAKGQGVLRSLNEEMRDLLGDITGSKTKVVGLGKAIYHTSWDLAWTMDEMIRMSTYQALRKKGMTVTEAAQVAAKFHGDYASVPPKTRRMLNRIFFTPTFKIVMGKMYIEAGKSLGKAAYKGAALGKAGKISRTEFAMARGALGIVATNIAFDLLMKSLGWEPEDDAWYNAGRRYQREVYDSRGIKSTQVVTWSNPGNMLQRYAQKMSKFSLTKGFTQSMLNILYNDIHPLFRTAKELYTNKQWNGAEVWNENDSTSMQAAKQASYALAQIVKIGEIFKEYEGAIQSDSTLETKKMIENMPFAVKSLLDGPLSIMSMHIKDPAIMREVRILKGMLNRAKRDQKAYYKNHGKLNPMWLNNMKKKIEKIKERLKEIE